MAESRQTFLHDVIYSFLPFTISKLRGIIVIPILTKIFGAGTYGVWVQYAVTLILIEKLASLGLQNSMNRYLTGADDNRVREDYYAILTVTIVTAVAIGLFLVVFRRTVAGLLFPTADGEIILVLLAAASLSNVYFSQMLQLLRSQRKIKNMNLWRSARILGELSCLLVGGLLLDSIVEVLFGILLVYISFSLILSVRVVSIIGISIPKFTNLRMHLGFGVPLLFSSLAYWVVNTSDRYIITYFSGVEAVGTYSVIYAIASVIGMVSHPVVNVLFPDLSALRDDGAMGEARSRFGDVVRYFLLFAAPAIVGVTVLRESVVRLISTADIAGSANLIAVLAPAMALYGLFNIFVQVLKVDERAKFVGLLWGVVAVSNVLLNLLLVPLYDITGAAIATLSAFSVGFFLAGWYLQENLVQMQFDLVKILISASLMGIIVWWAKQQLSPVGLFSMATLITIGIGTYAIVSYQLHILSEDEIRYIQEKLS